MPTHLLIATLLLTTGQARPIQPPRPDTPGSAGNVTAPAQPKPNATANQPRSVQTDPQMGLWLVNLARHQGHLVGRTDPRRSSLQILALLRAAVDASPDCAEAYYWLYDLEGRMDRQPKARRALEHYCRLRPDDAAARLLLLDLQLQDQQTAEARAAFVKEQLGRKPLSRVFASELHRRLANHAFERQDTPTASREVEEALRLNPMNVAARQLAYRIFRETEPALQRVEMALQLIGINPGQANLVWDLAEFLDRLSLHTQAQQWYRRAIELHRRANNAAVPAEYLHKLAVSYADAGNFAQAKVTADRALLANPEQMTTRLLRARALRKLGKDAAAAADLAYVSKAYAARIDTVLKNKDFPAAAEIAWFYCYHQPNPRRALQLAELAVSEPRPSLLARIAYGYALDMNGRTDQAVKVLTPLAGIDQLAAYKLALLQIEKDQKDQAIATLQKAAAIRSSGIAYKMISSLLAKYDQKPPTPPSYDKLIAALASFPSDVFDYPSRPQDFLKVTLHFVDDPLPPIGPINVTFRAENVGPFPITFGEGFMAMPLVAVSARVGGPSGHLYENYLQVLMNSRPTLLPGDAIEKTVAIDVGPIREDLRRKITQPVPIEVTAMFDPVYEQKMPKRQKVEKSKSRNVETPKSPGAERLTAGLGTITTAPIRTVRSALDVSPAGITALLQQARSADATQRIHAAEQIGALLAAGEKIETSKRQNVETSKRQNVEMQARGLPVDSLLDAEAKLLSDPAWQVRAHALVAVGWSTMSKGVTVAAAACVRDAMPVVKTLAVRLFAEQHGEKFRQVLEQLDKSDPCPYVRMMAASYLPITIQAQAGNIPQP